MRYLVVLVTFLFFPTVMVAQATTNNDASKYIGYEYEGVVPNKMLPNGVMSLGGSLIGDINADPIYEIAQMQKGTTTMLWLNVSTGQDSGGVTGWRVLDALAFPRLLKTEYVIVGEDPSVHCLRNGEAIPNIAGVGRILRQQGIYKPSKLWTANLTTKKFEPISLAGVRCEYSEP